MIRRREFIAGLGSAAALPVMAQSQQDERLRRIAVLLGEAPTERNFGSFTAFREAIAKLGWISVSLGGAIGQHAGSQ